VIDPGILQPKSHEFRPDGESFRQCRDCGREPESVRHQARNAVDLRSAALPADYPATAGELSSKLWWLEDIPHVRWQFYGVTYEANETQVTFSSPNGAAVRLSIRPRSSPPPPTWKVEVEGEWIGGVFYRQVSQVTDARLRDLVSGALSAVNWLCEQIDTASNERRRAALADRAVQTAETEARRRQALDKL
jgi:hypothetical protein